MNQFINDVNRGRGGRRQFRYPSFIIHGTMLMPRAIVVFPFPGLPHLHVAGGCDGGVLGGPATAANRG